MSPTKVLFITQEMSGYMPESEIANMGRFLPQGIQDKGYEIRTFMPRYGCVNERRNQLHEVIRLSGMNIIIDDTDHPLIIKVASLPSAHMQIYFIDNDDYFQRRDIVTDDNGIECEDNDERGIFFVRGVMETVKKLRWAPDIIHCHGWFTALTPLYIKKAFADDPCFRNTKVIYSIYDNEFKVPFPSNYSEKILFDALDANDITLPSNKEIDHTTLTKLAIDFSDGVIQGSETISNELIAYAQSVGKPFLTHQLNDTYIDAYDNFYTSIIGDAVTSEE